MTRDVLHSLELFIVVVLTHLLDFCDANLFRFASSERLYLAKLANDAKALVGDSFPIAETARAIVLEAGHGTLLFRNRSLMLCLSGASMLIARFFLASRPM